LKAGSPTLSYKGSDGMVIAVNLWDNSPKVLSLLSLSATADFYDRFALSQSFQGVRKSDRQELLQISVGNIATS
jgi:hypothetical protein